MSQDTQLGVQVVADIADFQKKFDDMKSQLSSIGESTKQSGEQAATGLAGVRKEVESIGTLLKSGLLLEGGRMITELVTAPLIGLGKEAVRLADNLHRSETAFGVMLGSGDKARAMLKDLQQFAATTPFEFPELIKAAQKMSAFGIAADKIVPTMRTVGDAVAGLGGSSEMFDRIIRAMGQMDAKGKVSAQEMNQFAEAGINAWQSVATALGVTVAEAMDQAKAGQISAATALTAIQADMTKKFGGMMAEQSKTIQGTLANIKDTVGFIMTDIGQQLIETLQLREVLGSVQSFAQGFLSWFRDLDAGTKKTVLALTAAFAAGGPIIVTVGAFMAAMAVVTAPMLVTGAIITGLVAGGALLIAHWGMLKTTATSIWSAITGTIQGWAQTVNQTIDKAVFGTAAAFRSLKDQSIKLVSDMVTEIGNWLGTKLTAIFDKMRAPIDAATGWFRGMYDAVVGHSYIPDMVEEIGQHMKLLDVNMTSPARNATRNTGRILEGAAFEWSHAFSEFATTANFGWGSLAQTAGSSLAQMTQGAADWGRVMTQTAVQVLGQMAATALQIAAQWAIAEAMRVTATETANATIAGSTAATSGGMLAVFSAAGAAIKAIMLGLAHAVVSIIGLVVSGISTVLEGISYVLAVALEAIAEMIFAAAAAVQSIPIIGQILGAIMVGAGALVMAAAVALPAMIAGVGALLSAGVGTLAAAIPAFADGGAVFGPTLALVGERASRGNPEYIGHASQLGLDRGGRQTVIVQLDGRTIAEAIVPHQYAIYRLMVGNR